jgi:hypothetical protein
MILNVWSVTTAFLAGISALLALAVGALAVRFGLAGRGRARVASGAAQTGEESERRARLLLLLVAVLGLVRLVAWPELYLLLTSYVPELAPFGVMCAYGVTRVHPTQVLLLQVLGPALLWGIGLWCALAFADRGGRSGLAPIAWLAFALAALALAVSGLELTYVFSEKLGRTVTCCTGADALGGSARADLVSPLQSFGVVSARASLALFLAGNGVVIAFAWLLRGRLGRLRRSRASLLLAALALLAAANLGLTAGAWLDAIAPRLLGLPHHHCVYELVSGSPDLALAAALAIAGNACLLWPLPLELSSGPERGDSIAGLQQGILGGCAVALASELAILAVRWW